eukprot:XP_027304019.1 myosin-11-like isoform X1 [Anas platyrhynchos]
MREEMERILTEKLAVLQSQVEVSQHAAPPPEELANTQTSLQAISEQMQSLATSLHNIEASRKQDLEVLRAEMQAKISKDLEAAKTSWSEENLLEIDNKLGRTVDRNTARALESMREEMERILTEKLAVLQSQVEVSQHAAPPPEELANTQTSLQAISEQMQSLATSLHNIEASRKQDLEVLRAEMQAKISKDLEAAKTSWSEENLLEIDNKLGRTVDRNTARALESMREEMERILTEKLAVLQSQVEVSQHAAPPPEELANTQTSLQAISEQMQSLATSLHNIEASRKQDLEVLRAEMQAKISKDLEAAKTSWSEENLLEIDNKLGRTVDRNTARALESMREEMERILTEKLAVLQSQVEVSQHAAPPPEELANTQTSLQAISEQMQSLATSLHNIEASRKQDLEVLRAEMQAKISKDLEAAKTSWSEENLLEIDNKLGRTVDRNTARALESMREEMERILTEKLAVLQSQVEVSQHAAPPPEELANTQTSLQAISEQMQSLATSLHNIEASRKQDLEVLRAEMQAKISKDLEAAKTSWSEENLLEIDNKLGRTVDRNTARALESMREEMERILTEKLAVLQSQVEVSQHAAPPPEELANTQTSLQAISEQMQSLATSLHNIEASRKQDLEVLRAEMQAKISKDLEAAKTSWSEENLLEIDNKLGRTVDRNTARALESMREEMERILTEKLAVLQSQVEVSQHAAPPPEELANTQTSLQAISEQMQSLATSLHNIEASRKQDLEVLRAEMQAKISKDLEAAKTSWSEENLLEIDNKLGRTVDRNTARALESMREEMERILTEKLAVLQSQVEVSQHAAPPPEELANTQTSLQAISEQMQSLTTSLHNIEASRKQDLEVLRAEMQAKISKDLEAAKTSWSEENLLEIDNKLGRTVDRNTARALESMREEMERILTEKLAVLQSQVEVSQHAAPPPEELANTQTSLQAISEQMQSLTTSLHNIEASRKQDLEVLRAEMQAKISKDLEAAKTSWSEENLLEIDNKLGRTVDRNTARALESMREEMERILTEKLAVLQSQVEVSQHAAPPPKELANTQTSLQAISEQMQSLTTSLQNTEASRKQDLEILKGETQGKISKDLEAAKTSWSEENLLKIDSEQEELQAPGRMQGDADTMESLKKENELLHAQRYKVDVTLDADTAHPRLEVSKDGKSVTDTGAIRRVHSKKERFDSHTFVLAKEGYASGRLYWEVDVGKRRNWILGVAQEAVTRKGTLDLFPQNGFWAIGLSDGQDYWAYTDPWTRLTVGGKPRKIGIFLDISAKKLLFYNVHQKNVLYTFSFDSSQNQEMKLFPFFSTGPTATQVDTEPLQIAQGFDDDDK